MKLLNRQELIEHPEVENVIEGTNRILEFPFRIEIEGILNIVFTDVMIVVKDGDVETIEFDVVDRFYTQDQADGITNLLKRELC